MTENISERIARLCMQRQQLIYAGLDDEADALAAEVQALSDHVMLSARQRNESVQEMGVS